MKYGLFFIALSCWFTFFIAGNLRADELILTCNSTYNDRWLGPISSVIDRSPDMDLGNYSATVIIDLATGTVVDLLGDVTSELFGLAVGCQTPNFNIVEEYAKIKIISDFQQCENFNTKFNWRMVISRIDGVFTRQFGDMASGPTFLSEGVCRKSSQKF